MRNVRKVWEVSEKVICAKSEVCVEWCELTKWEECEEIEEMWDVWRSVTKVICVRGDGRSVRKNVICKKQWDEQEKWDVWEKVREVWQRVRYLKNESIMKKSEKCEKQWDVWEKLREV